jgi:hypothetical protein
LEDTIERFNYGDGRVQWRKAPLSFSSPTSPSSSTSSLPQSLWPVLFTLGIADDALLKGPGGIFFGLIRDIDDGIRPSFLGQTDVRSFVIDLKAPEQESLTLHAALSRRVFPAARSAIPLVTDLKSTYDFPVLHYTAQADAITINGRPFVTSLPIYIIFDTGVSGMVVSQELYDAQYQTARKHRDKQLWGTVDVHMATVQGRQQTVSARNPITTLQAMFWPSGKQEAHVIVMGLAFLAGHRMTVDMDGQKVWID